MGGMNSGRPKAVVTEQNLAEGLWPATIVLQILGVSSESFYRGAHAGSIPAQLVPPTFTGQRGRWYVRVRELIALWSKGSPQQREYAGKLEAAQKAEIARQKRVVKK